MAVADVVVSKVLDILISGITSEVDQEMKLVVGVKKEVKMLTENLKSIQAVLIDAEKRQLKEETIKLWLHRLKEISYDIDDVLDDWSTEILKSKIEGDDYEYIQRPKRIKVLSFFLSFCSCFREIGFRRDIAVKIKELNESLDLIAKEKDRYSFHLIKENEIAERVMTTSVVKITEVKGREDDKNAVRNLLLADDIRNPHVISIVGMGGIGKTTLAKLVFNDDSVRANFDKIIWVCVSDPFDETRIAKAILESFSESASNFVELQRIVQEIQRHIEKKKILLVLDDVWNEDSTKWEQVEHFLERCLLGSKILVTTRNENVARVMGCRDIIRLGLLSNEECWSIFSRIVFSESSVERKRSLEGIGRKFVDRCKGLPLAVKTVAGLLCFKESIGEWQGVLDSELWELEKVEKEVLAPLLLSYYDLPSSLKQCFLYSAVFPKDHIMSKRELIEMWMSQGYIRETQNKTMEMVGDEYFQNLGMRSFFQDFEEDDDDNSNMYCKVHDVVHDFARSLMKNNECCNIEVNNHRGQTIDFDNNEIHHVGVMIGEDVPFPSSLYNLRKLRGLIVLSVGYRINRVDLAHMFGQLTCLRSLSLSMCGIGEIPSNICKLIHLRQLDLSHNRKLKELPETICKLYNLQILNVEWCDSLISLPRGIGKLINLRCLYNKRCWRCFLPKEIRMLSGLRRLSMIRIGEQEPYLCLRDLKNLNHLGGYLFINLNCGRRNVKVEEAKEAQLTEKKSLTYLIICFSIEGGGEGGGGGGGGGGDGEERGRKEEGELLEALEPSPTNLKSLIIYNYKGSNKIRCSPSWIRWLSILRKLELNNWRNCEQLPHSLGKLPSLEFLIIKQFYSLKRVGVEFYGMMDDDDDDETATIFPKLIELEFRYVEDWEEWKELDEEEEDGVDKKRKKKKRNNDRIIKIMPSLCSLTLEYCPKLKTLPHYILQNTTLKLDVQRCPALQQTRVTLYGSPQPAASSSSTPSL